MQDIVMDVCVDRLDQDCWGCPFKEKATRSKTCKEWIDDHKQEATEIATTYINNGWCLYDKKNPPYVGRIDKERVRQICPRCQHISVLNNKEVYMDSYIGKWMWTCPHCHHSWKLMKSKKMSEDLDASKGVTA